MLPPQILQPLPECLKYHHHSTAQYTFEAYRKQNSRQLTHSKKCCIICSDNRQKMMLIKCSVHHNANVKTKLQYTHIFTDNIHAKYRWGKENILFVYLFTFIRQQVKSKSTLGQIISVICLGTLTQLSRTQTRYFAAIDRADGSSTYVHVI